MKILHINVLDKQATYLSRDGDIVCGNSDYVIEFAFDAEWAAHNEKIARFIWNDHYTNVEFTGTTCPVPIITGASEVKVGVYAGELNTTTPAVIGCLRSILCESTTPGSSPMLNGDSVFIRYSAYADGTDFTETRSARQFYIGLATGQNAPTDKSGYEWFHIASNIRATEVITLSADAWQDNTQAVPVPCVMSGSAATASPDTDQDNIDAYIEHGILLHSLGNRSLTFTCATQPEVDIVVVAEILDPVAFGEPVIPEISEADNGKGLLVQNGEWSVGEVWHDTAVFDLSEQISITEAMAQSSSTQHASYSFEYDTTAIREALRKGPIKIKYSEGVCTMTTFAFSKVRDQGEDADSACDIITLDAHTHFSDQPYHFTLRVYSGRIECHYEQILPNVSNDDNGKILGVENGQWKAVESIDYVATQSKDGLMSADDKKKLDDIDMRTHPQLVPVGDYIPSGANLNSAAYLKVGSYYNSKNEEVSSMTNCPATRGFLMYVYSPLAKTYDNETTATWVYRTRKLMDYEGNEWVQLCVSDGTIGNFSYGAWKQILKANDATELENTVSQHTQQIADLREDRDGLDERVTEIERDHQDNTGFVNFMTSLAENPENEGKVYAVKDEQISLIDIPSGGMPEINNIETPTNSKYVMRDTDGNLAAVSPINPMYPNFLWSYTHTGNKEVYVTEVDLTTGAFTATGHDLVDNSIVVATVDPPYNVGLPYDYLPKGLLLSEEATTATKSSKTYQVHVIDSDHFSLIDPVDGTGVTFTSNSKMDLTKFHFEQIPENMELELAELNLQECFIVVKGKILNSFRWAHPTNRMSFGTGAGNKTGAVSYDTANGTDNYGSCNLGRPGNHYCYATLEMRAMGNQQASQVNTQHYIMYTEQSIPNQKHTRQYFIMRLTSDTIEGVKFYGDTNGGFFNGTSVEVYTK